MKDVIHDGCCDASFQMISQQTTKPDADWSLLHAVILNIQCHSFSKQIQVRTVQMARQAGGRVMNISKQTGGYKVDMQQPLIHQNVYRKHFCKAKGDSTGEVKRGKNCRRSAVSNTSSSIPIPNGLTPCLSAVFTSCCQNRCDNLKLTVTKPTKYVVLWQNNAATKYNKKICFLKYFINLIMTPTDVCVVHFMCQTGPNIGLFRRWWPMEMVTFWSSGYWSGGMALSSPDGG